jgi:hypothetical protein
MIVLALLGHSLTLAVQGSVLLAVVGFVSLRIRRHPRIRYRGPIGWFL